MLIEAINLFCLTCMGIAAVIVLIQEMIKYYKSK
jgi:hypothetical protein